MFLSIYHDGTKGRQLLWRYTTSSHQRSNLVKGFSKVPNAGSLKVAILGFKGQDIFVVLVVATCNIAISWITIRGSSLHRRFLASFSISSYQQESRWFEFREISLISIENWLWVWFMNFFNFCFFKVKNVFSILQVTSTYMIWHESLTQTSCAPSATSSIRLSFLTDLCSVMNGVVVSKVQWWIFKVH